MEATRVAPQDTALAEALDSLANPTRLALLRHLRTPRILKDIEVRVPEGDAGRERPISRQGVKQHLNKLLELGIVEARALPREKQGGPEYIVNHQRLFALAEEFRELARLRASEELRQVTMDGRTKPDPPAVQGPRLVLVKGLEEGRTFSLRAATSREWTIGRRRGAEVPLDFDPFVSTEHAVVGFEGGAYWVQDLAESRNGTSVNFDVLPKGGRKALATGDVIGIGRSLLLFRS